jgi:tetratricopeptide (TPR) repeat protein
MAKASYGPKVQERTKRLLKVLLAYANDELENTECLPIKFNWKTENELVVETQVRFLAKLTDLDAYEGKLDTEQIKEAIHRLEDLKILKDNRPGDKGLHGWYLTLTLWHSRQDKPANLKRFDLEWKRLRSQKIKPARCSNNDSLQNHEKAPEIYNDNGVGNYLNSQISQALCNFGKALELDQNFAETHYNLGLLYEDMRDFDRAGSEYKLAMLGGLASAYNNLARIHILDKNYAAAVDLLLKGLKLAKHDVENYALRKNLGWARLGQGRYAEAKAELMLAIDLDGKKASAYGLLAQALEELEEKAEALVAWENCLKYASSYQPDEDTWIDLARQRLAENR